MFRFIICSFFSLLLTCTAVFGQIQDGCQILSETEEDSLRQIISRLNQDDIEVEIITQPNGDPLLIAQDRWHYWHTNPHQAKFHIVLVRCGTPTDVHYYTAVYGLKHLLSQEDIDHVLSILKQYGRLSPATAFSESLNYVIENNHLASKKRHILFLIFLIFGITITFILILFARAKLKEKQYELNILGFTFILPVIPQKRGADGSGCSSAGGCSSGCSSGCGGCGGGGCGS
jgi:uncharacterized membrane protein YgcG